MASRAEKAVAVGSQWGVEPDLENHPWLELRGTLSEPIRDARDVVFSTYPKDKVEVRTARPAAVGSIIRLRPYVSVVVAYPPLEFDRLWALALGGHAKHAYLSCTEPHYQRALVTSLSFSNEQEE